MKIDQFQQSIPYFSDETENTKDKKLELIVFPKRFLNPLITYRMNGDFHLYSDAKFISYHNSLKLGTSCQNPYKKISRVVVDQENGKIILHYSQLDFTQTPWEYVVKRLESFGDVQMNELSQYIKQYYEQLNSGLKKQKNKKNIKKEGFRSSGSYQYRYVKEINQFFISQMHYDIKLIEDLGFTVQQFVESCLKVGIQEISLKPGSTNAEYYKNVMEFAKPLTKPEEEQDFYLYSFLYPQGLKTEVSFLITNEFAKSDEDNEEISVINFNFYLHYNPIQIKQQALVQTKQLKSQNCVSHYYDLMDMNFKRCGYKKVKLEQFQ